jgi:4-hydroxy-tetrahydrodipicolinate reductase
MLQEIKVIVVGIGEMGGQAVKMILEKRKLKLVGAIGHRKGVGEDLGKMIGLDRDLGIIISADAEKIYKTIEADIVLHFAASTLQDAYYQIKGALETGKNVITIAEEASFPWLTGKQIADEIDKIAKEKRVTFVGTGINPGFIFDYLPIVMTSALKEVNKIHIQRVTDFAKYGTTVWKHLGVGRTLESFKEGLAYGDIMLHVGLEQTVNILAKALGWDLDDFQETREGIISKSQRIAKYGTINPGTICGFKQIGKGFSNGKENITQEIMGIIMPNQEEDGVEVGTSIMIDGVPSAKIVIGGELAAEGGYGTVARAVNSIPQVIAAPPGILTVDQLPPSPCLN